MASTSLIFRFPFAPQRKNVCALTLSAGFGGANLATVSTNYDFPANDMAASWRIASIACIASVSHVGGMTFGAPPERLDSCCGELRRLLLLISSQ